MTAIHDTAIVRDGANLADDVTVGPHSIISAGTSVGSGTTIGSNVTTEGTVEIGNNNQINKGVVIGTDPQSWEIEHDDTGVKIGDGNIIREYSTINRAMEESGAQTKIGDDNMLMTYSHVAHDCTIGNHVTLTNSAGMAGHVTIQDHVTIGGLAAFHQYVRVGAYSMVGGVSRITQDVVPFSRVAGNPAEMHGLNAVGLRRNGFDRDDRKNLKQAYRFLFREGLNTSQALEKIREEMAVEGPVKQLVEFVESTDRGIHK